MVINPEDVYIRPDKMVCIDGVNCFRIVDIEGKLFIQFFDKDKKRSDERGSRMIEIELCKLVEIIKNP